MPPRRGAGVRRRPSGANDRRRTKGFRQPRGLPHAAVYSDTVEVIERVRAGMPLQRAVALVGGAQRRSGAHRVTVLRLARRTLRRWWAIQWQLDRAASKLLGASEHAPALGRLALALQLIREGEGPHGDEILLRQDVLRVLQHANSLHPTNPSHQEHFQLSVPPWALEALRSDPEVHAVPALAAQWLQASFAEAPLTIRVNLLKGDRATLLQQLEKRGHVPLGSRAPKEEDPDEADAEVGGDPVGPGWSPHPRPHPWCDTALILERGPAHLLPEFAAGWFEPQDAASQLAVALLDPRPGERVLDLCAGTGGKTLAIAAAMRNRGTLLAFCPDDQQRMRLRQRAARAGVSCHRILENGKQVKRLKGTIDRVLVDAPCTGLGVIARHPEVLLAAPPGTAFHQRQVELLERGARTLAPGGSLVYCTCTRNATENEQVVDALLATDSTMGLQPPPDLFPVDLLRAYGGDGGSGPIFAVGEGAFSMNGFWAARLTKVQQEPLHGEGEPDTEALPDRPEG